jgi:hypothetical protein
MASWQGTDSNERAFNGVRNALVDIYLWGVKGVSEDHGYGEQRMVSPEAADRYINKARTLYVNFVEQKAPASAKAFHSHKIKELDGLIRKAVAVREGGQQKMTADEYAAYRKSLGLR